MVLDFPVLPVIGQNLEIVSFTFIFEGFAEYCDKPFFETANKVFFTDIYPGLPFFPQKRQGAT